MDPLWSETCWSTFKYFTILILSTCYKIVRKLDNKIFICWSCTVHIWRSRLVLSKVLGSNLATYLHLVPKLGLSVTIFSLILMCLRSVGREILTFCFWYYEKKNHLYSLWSLLSGDLITIWLGQWIDAELGLDTVTNPKIQVSAGSWSLPVYSLWLHLTEISPYLTPCGMVIFEKFLSCSRIPSRFSAAFTWTHNFSPFWTRSIYFTRCQPF